MTAHYVLMLTFYFFNYSIIDIIKTHFSLEEAPERKEGSHFNPYNNLFPPNEKKGIAISTVCLAYHVIGSSVEANHFRTRIK